MALVTALQESDDQEDIELLQIIARMKQWQDPHGTPLRDRSELRDILSALDSLRMRQILAGIRVENRKIIHNHLMAFSGEFADVVGVGVLPFLDSLSSSTQRTVEVETMHHEGQQVTTCNYERTDVTETSAVFLERFATKIGTHPSQMRMHLSGSPQSFEKDLTQPIPDGVDFMLVDISESGWRGLYDSWKGNPSRLCKEMVIQIDGLSRLFGEDCSEFGSLVRILDQVVKPLERRRCTASALPKNIAEFFAEVNKAAKKPGACPRSVAQHIHNTFCQ